MAEINFVYNKQVSKIKRLLFSQTSKDIIICSTGTGITALVGMFFAILLARSLSVSDFGIHSALVTVVVLLAITGDFGISSALTYFIPKTKTKYSQFLSVAFWFQFMITFGLVTVVLILNRPLRALIIPDSTISQFVWVALLILTSSLNGFAQGILKAKRQFLGVALMQFIESIGKILVVVYLYLQNMLTVETALMAVTLAMIISATVGLSKEYKHIKLIFPRTQLKGLFSFAKWIGVQRVFNTIFSRIDIILLTSLSTSFYAGIFSVASRITILFVILAGSVSNVISPRFSSFKSRLNVREYLKKVFIMEAGMALIMLIVAVSAPTIINLIFGVKYQSATPVFRLLTIAMIPYLFTTTIMDSLIYSFKKTGFAMKVSMFQVFLVILLNVILIPHHNALAPAISLLVINISSLFLVSYKLKKLFVI